MFKPLIEKCRPIKTTTTHETLGEIELPFYYLFFNNIEYENLNTFKLNLGVNIDLDYVYKTYIREYGDVELLKNPVSILLQEEKEIFLNMVKSKLLCLQIDNYVVSVLSSKGASVFNNTEYISLTDDKIELCFRIRYVGFQGMTIEEKIESLTSSLESATIAKAFIVSVLN